MSILQEYEEIKKQIGQEKWDSIDTYIQQNPNLTFDIDPNRYRESITRISYIYK